LHVLLVCDIIIFYNKEIIKKKRKIMSEFNEFAEKDIFEDAQKIYDEAAGRVESVRNGALFDFEEYAAITKEYGRLLWQIRRSTRLADRTAANLHEIIMDLEDKIHYDALTGIYNRRFIEENLKRIVRSLARSGGFLSVLMIDIDYFKDYNDTYGHSEGDVCLKVVAETISGSLLRADDFAARYGGEEFVVILPDTDETGARTKAEIILDNIREKNVPHENSKAASYVTVSIGVTTSIVQQGQSGADYIKRADEALYMAKQSGRNRYVFIGAENS